MRPLIVQQSAEPSYVSHITSSTAGETSAAAGVKTPLGEIGLQYYFRSHI